VLETNPYGSGFRTRRVVWAHHIYGRTLWWLRVNNSSVCCFVFQIAEKNYFRTVIFRTVLHSCAVIILQCYTEMEKIGPILVEKCKLRPYNITSCTTVQAVVMGKGKCRPPWLQNPWTYFDETWNIWLCRWYDHTCKSTWRCDNVGGLGEHVTCHMFWFRRPFFVLYNWDRAAPSTVDRFWRSICRMACFRARMCLLGIPLLPLTI